VLTVKKAEKKPVDPNAVIPEKRKRGRPRNTSNRLLILLLPPGPVFCVLYIILAIIHAIMEVSEVFVYHDILGCSCNLMPKPKSNSNRKCARASNVCNLLHQSASSLGAVIHETWH
jgi:hypothetical protein